MLEGHIHVLPLADIGTGSGEHGHGPDLGVFLCVDKTEVLEGAGVEHVPGKDAGGHVPLRVHGLHAAAQAVVVHDIVVDEREGVRHLERKGSLHDIVRLPVLPHPLPA